MMDNHTSIQRHSKAAVKREQEDVSISPAEREQARRSANMAAIRSKDTKPEMVVRRYLWSMGFRYRLNHRRLPGKPDIVLRRYRTCIFVNGCFWHGHNVTQSRVQESSSCSLHSLVQDTLLVQGFKGGEFGVLQDSKDEQGQNHHLIPSTKGTVYFSSRTPRRINRTG